MTTLRQGRGASPSRAGGARPETSGSGPATAGSRSGMGGSPRRLVGFVRERFPLRVYGTYAVLWVLALDGCLARVLPSGESWRLGPHTVAEVLSVLVALLFARVVDEQKDLAYDRVHHPDRPLVRGTVRVGELRLLLLACVLVLVAVNLPMSPLLAGWLLLALGYICFLVRLERWSRRVREGLFLNLAVSYTAQLLLSGYVLLAAVHRGAAAHWRAIPVLAMFALVFLHFEFARKTSWSYRDAAHLYSNVVGARGGAALVVGTATCAGMLALLLFTPWQIAGVAAFAAWLPFSAVGFLWRGAERFLTRATPVWPSAPAMGFLAWFYLGLVVQVGATAPVVWSP